MEKPGYSAAPDAGEKKLDALGARLSELEGTLDHLSPKTYTQHFAINAILQNSAAKAAAMGSGAFHAQASIPAEVEIREGGPVRPFLLNMLDNALRPPQPGGAQRSLVQSSPYPRVFWPSSVRTPLAAH